MAQAALMPPGWKPGKPQQLKNNFAVMKTLAGIMCYVIVNKI
jgi:hypothetical protein